MSAQPLPAPQHDPAIQAILDRLKARGIDLQQRTRAAEAAAGPQPVAIGQSQHGRTIYQLPGEKPFSEITRTVQVEELNEGRYTNIPTVFEGRKLSLDEAIDKVLAAGGRDPETGAELEGFELEAEALTLAQRRSDQIRNVEPRQVEARGDLLELDPTIQRGPDDIGGGPDPFPGPTGQGPRARTKLEEMKLLFAVPAVGAATGLNQILLNAANLADGASRIIEARTGLERGKGFEVVAGWLKEQVEAGAYTLETLPKPDTFAEQVVTAVGTGALMLPVFAVPKALSSVAGLPVLGAISGSDRGLSGALEGAAFFTFIDRFIHGMAPASRTLRGTSVAGATYLFERGAGRTHEEAMVAASALGIFGAANRPILRRPITARELPLIAADQFKARLGKGEIRETPPAIEKQIDVLDRMLQSDDVAEVRFAERELAAMEGRLVEEPQDVTRLFDEIEAADAAPRAQPTENVPGTVIRVAERAPARAAAEPAEPTAPKAVETPERVTVELDSFRVPIENSKGEAVGSVVGDVVNLNGRPTYRVRNAGIDEPGNIGQGNAVRAYEALAQRAQRDGRDLVSDVEVTEAAARVYEALGRRGFNVTRDDRAVFKDGQWEMPKSARNAPVFRIEPTEARSVPPATVLEPKRAAPRPTRVKLGRMIDDIREGVEEPPNLPRFPILALLARKGGVDPDSPLATELALAGVPKSGPGSIPGLFRKGGMKALDKVDLGLDPLFQGNIRPEVQGRNQLEDSALLDPREVLDAISNETHGKPLRTQAETDRITRFQSERQELAAELDAMDVDLRGQTNAQIIKRLERAAKALEREPEQPKQAPPPKPPPRADKGPAGPRGPTQPPGGGGTPPRRPPGPPEPPGGGAKPGVPEPGPEPTVSFKTGNRVAIDPPREVTVEEITAKLTELQAQGLSPETAIDYLLSKSDLTLGDSAGRILPAVIEFYRPQIEQLRRGVMPDQHVRELAQMMGMTEEQLVSRRVGQPMDAPTALAARDLVARQLAIVDGALDRATRGGPREEIMFEQELAKLQIFYAQLRGAVSEMGRAFRILRMPAEAERAAGGRLRFEDLPELMAGMRGEQTTRVLIRKLNKLRSEPFSQRGMMRQSVNARTVDKVLEFYRAWLLQGPRTLARNFAGNSAFAIMAPLETEFSATLGRMIRKSPFQDLDIPLLRRLSRVRQDPEKLKRLDDMFEKGIVDERIYQGEGFAQLYGQVQAGRVALQLFWRGLVGVPGEGVGMARGIFQLPKRLLLTERAPPSIDSKTERRPGGAIGGTTGTIIRTPFRVLEAFDEGFRYPAVQGKLHQLGYRVAAKQGLHGKELVHAIQDFVAEPPQWAAQKARAFGREAIFTEPLGFRGRAVRNVVKAFPGTLEPLFLFQRTPINLLKTAGRRSPLALMMSDVQEDLEAGGARADQARGRIVLGTSIAMYIAHLANAGLITGAGSDDPKRRAVEWELGWRPYSVLLKIPERLGGDGQWTYYGYRGMEPASQHLGVVADIVEGYHRLNDAERNLGFALIGASFINNTLDMSMMASLSGMIEAIGSPERNMDRFVNNFVASGIQPRLLAPFYEKADPMIRDARTMLQSVQTRLGLGNSEFDTFGIGPGLKLVPAKLAYWGQDRKRDKFIPGVGPLSGVTPFRISPQIEDKPSSESLRLGVFLEMPDRKIGLVELTPWQYWEMAGKARRNAKRSLDVDMSKPFWDKLSTSEEGRFIQREWIRTTILSNQQIQRAYMVGRMKRADQFRAFLDRDLASLFQRSQGVIE